MSGTWDRPHYTNVQMPFPGDPPETPALNPTGVYERDIEVPEAWAGRRIVLHVGAAESVLIVSLDGIEIGVGKDSHLASEFDLTAYLRPGRHTLTLRVVKWSDASYVEDQDQWWHGGITRPVYLYATSDVYLADVRIDAGLADDLTTGVLDMTVTVGFPGSGLAVRLDDRGGHRGGLGERPSRSDVLPVRRSGHVALEVAGRGPLVGDEPTRSLSAPTIALRTSSGGPSPSR